VPGFPALKLQELKDRKVMLQNGKEMLKLKAKRNLAGSGALKESASIDKIFPLGNKILLYDALTLYFSATDLPYSFEELEGYGLFTRYFTLNMKEWNTDPGTLFRQILKDNELECKVNDMEIRCIVTPRRKRSARKACS